MTLTPALRKLGLTTHISFSVGWFGAIAAFLALPIAGVASQNPASVTDHYISMELIGWFLIVPLCLATFITGVLQALGTEWGLLKHYWVAVKLFLTVVATILLFLHMQPITYLAEVASKKILSYSELRGLRVRLIADAGVALFVLLAATTLSVYKPWGRTRLASKTVQVKNKSSWGLYVLLTLIGALVLIAILHLFGIGLGHG